MNVHLVEQRTPQWLELRAACFMTASEMGVFLTKNDAKSISARTNFIARKLAEPIYNNPSLSGYDFLQKIREKEEKAFEYNLPVQRGNALEAEAREFYAKRIGAPVHEVGFITDPTGVFGCSPDLVVCSREMTAEDTAESFAECIVYGGEIKCPIPETHIKWLLAGTLPEEHKVQVHSSMAVSGLHRWDFISYCPGLPPLVLTVHRERFTNELAAGMRDLFSEFCITGAKLREMWNRELGDAMKERPILFSAPMVLAILDGRKTQTRRMVANESLITLHADWTPAKAQPKCPYGCTGDRLWVRETWRTDAILDDVRPRSMQEGIPIKYECDDEATDIVAFGWGRVRQSIFMRRWMSRITLEITAVRVERLQDISEADAEAEGVTEDFPEQDCNSSRPFAEGYRYLWESINGPGSWDQNPWVWVIEFKRISNQTTP